MKIPNNQFEMQYSSQLDSDSIGFEGWDIDTNAVLEYGLLIAGSMGNLKVL